MEKTNLLENVAGVNTLNVNGVSISIDPNKLLTVEYITNIGVIIKNGEALHAVEIPEGKKASLIHIPESKTAEIFFTDIVSNFIIDKRIIQINPLSDVNYNDYVFSLGKEYDIYYNNLVLKDITAVQKKKYSLYFINNKGDIIAQVGVLNTKYKLTWNTNTSLFLQEV